MSDARRRDDGEAPESIFVPSRPLTLASLDPNARYTGRQVKAMVEGAVKDRERELREEYDNLLADRLDEQWRTFAKFNETQLHAQLERSTYDYYC